MSTIRGTPPRNQRLESSFSLLVRTGRQHGETISPASLVVDDPLLRLASDSGPRERRSGQQRCQSDLLTRVVSMAEPAAELNVFKAASLCSQAFIKYSDASNGTIKDEIDVLQGRFNLWAAYTGVFAPVGASLDDRLEFQDDVKQMVVKLLSMVHRNIQCGL